MSRPAMQIGVDVEHDNGLYLYAWASNVDFVDNRDPDDGARWELELTLGYAIDLSDQLSAEINWINYRYPAAHADFDLDYDEWTASLFVGENYRLTAGYSDTVFGESASAPYYEVGSVFDIPQNLFLSFAVGYYDLDNAYQESYQYGFAAIGQELDQLGWELAYHRTSSSAEDIFYASTVDPRLVLNLWFYF